MSERRLAAAILELLVSGGVIVVVGLQGGLAGVDVGPGTWP